jgi:phosphinothricin acetyltransferase
VAVVCWRNTYAGLLRDETILAVLAGPYAIQNVRDRISGHDFLVAENANEIGAYADAVPEPGRLFLAAIYTLPARRGSGAGTALLDAIATRHSLLPIDANVLLGNRAGEDFYERRRFAPVETIETDLFGEAVTERRWHRAAGGVVTAGRDSAAADVAVRDASSIDAGAIAAIYNEGIDDGLATLETSPRTPEERSEWLAARGPRHPVLVAEGSEGTVVGWGSLNSFNPRAAYDHVVDFSVYVARDRRRHGIGGLLLTELMTRARAIGYHKMVLAALLANEVGTRLYERHGFSRVGIYREHGRLAGRWVDVVVMEKLL